MPNCKTVVPYHGTPEQEEELRQVIAAHRDQPAPPCPSFRRPSASSVICRRRR